jgi:hypothetical protein
MLLKTMCFSHTKRHVTFRGWFVGVSYLVCKKFVTFPIGLSIWDNWPFNKEVSNHGELLEVTMWRLEHLLQFLHLEAVKQ